MLSPNVCLCCNSCSEKSLFGNIIEIEPHASIESASIKLQMRNKRNNYYTAGLGVRYAQQLLTSILT